MENDGSEHLEDYYQEQLRAISAWKNRLPSVIGKVVGAALAPLGWAISRVVPPSAIEGALRGADWLAQQLLFEERIIREAGVGSIEEFARLQLKELDALAASFHRWSVGYAVVEGGAAGAAGIAGIPADIPAVIALALRTVRGIGVCYGYVDKTEAERQFVLGVIAAAGANSIQEKTTALVILRNLQVALLQQSFKSMGQKAASMPLGREAAIIALRNLARQLGVNLTKRKMLQAVPVVGGGIGAAVNGKFMDDIAWAARRVYQERWLHDRGLVSDPQ
jgi:uncharacterized protein (DUF697 family)